MINVFVVVVVVVVLVLIVIVIVIVVVVVVCSFCDCGQVFHVHACMFTFACAKLWL